MAIRFVWDERKRRANLQVHGLDFADARRVFEATTYTFEDDRLRYQEQRFVTLGFLDAVPVAMVHTETPTQIRVISFRKASRNEAAILFDNVPDRPQESH
jgi:uncharacterized DUF497 family protein